MKQERVLFRMWLNALQELHERYGSDYHDGAIDAIESIRVIFEELFGDEESLGQKLGEYIGEMVNGEGAPSTIGDYDD